MRFVPNGLTRPVARAVLKTRANSPHLMFAAGTVGVVATAVLASRATLKLDEVLTDIETTKQKVSDAEGTTLSNGHEYTPDEARRDRIVLHTQGALKIAKLYAPTIIVGTLSIGCLTGAHVTLTRRNVALTAAYAGLQKAYDGYRDRVREQYGEETELALHHGTLEREVVTETTNGPKKTTTTVIDGTRSMYARFFDETNKNWNREPSYNLVFLKCQQDYANNMLKARGHLFLNEVYDMLGIERTRAGAVVGWVLDGKGDSYVDFGLYDDRPQTRLFVNGQEPSILLDFNVDGTIYDKI
jgi:Family of unknown function (DUF6353)